MVLFSKHFVLPLMFFFPKLVVPPKYMYKFLDINLGEKRQDDKAFVLLMRKSQNVTTSSKRALSKRRSVNKSGWNQNYDSWLSFEFIISNQYGRVHLPLFST